MAAEFTTLINNTGRYIKIREFRVVDPTEGIGPIYCSEICLRAGATRDVEASTYLHTEGQVSLLRIWCDGTYVQTAPLIANDFIASRTITITRDLENAQFNVRRGYRGSRLINATQMVIEIREIGPRSNVRSRIRLIAGATISVNGWSYHHAEGQVSRLWIWCDGTYVQTAPLTANDFIDFQTITITQNPDVNAQYVVIRE